jgi:hypothetical protein
MDLSSGPNEVALGFVPQKETNNKALVIRLKI